MLEAWVVVVVAAAMVDLDGGTLDLLAGVVMEEVAMMAVGMMEVGIVIVLAAAAADTIVVTVALLLQTVDGTKIMVNGPLFKR